MTATAAVGIGGIGAIGIDIQASTNDINQTKAHEAKAERVPFDETRAQRYGDGPPIAWPTQSESPSISRELEDSETGKDERSVTARKSRQLFCFLAISAAGKRCRLIKRAVWGIAGGRNGSRSCRLWAASCRSSCSRSSCTGQDGAEREVSLEKPANVWGREWERTK